jgi:thiamine biosynthesis lipoprotein
VVAKAEHDVTFDAMGSHVRLLIGKPGPGMAPAATAAGQARQFVVEFDAALSRFKPGSELCALNADPRECVPASALLRAAVRAGIEAAERSGGLVDPTLVREIESAGYVASRADVPGAPLVAALAEAPTRRPARPSPAESWRRFKVDDAGGTISRPPGVRFDSGGAGKGLAADLIADRLRGYSRFIVDCGGDIRIGGPDALVTPYKVFVEHPLTGERAFVLKLGSGAVATSGLNVRIWRNESGRYSPPPARPGHRRAGLDRADRSHRPRRLGCRSGDLRQGGAPLRSRARPCGSRRTRRPARPRQRPGRDGRLARGPAPDPHRLTRRASA